MHVVFFLSPLVLRILAAPSCRVFVFDVFPFPLLLQAHALCIAHCISETNAINRYATYKLQSVCYLMRFCINVPFVHFISAWELVGPANLAFVHSSDLLSLLSAHSLVPPFPVPIAPESSPSLGGGLHRRQNRVGDEQT
jgi:hypothetical protein